MSKKYIYAGSLVGLILISTLISLYLVKNKSQDQTNLSSTVDRVEGTQKLSIASSTFNVLLADTSELRQKGLGGRSTIDPNEVMLFVFEEDAKHFFWMKDMQFAIDIVWLNSDKKILHIEHNVSPDTYPNSFGPQLDSRYVLEFREGTANKLKLQVGAGMSIEL